jgi:hypothetical protein
MRRLASVPRANRDNADGVYSAAAPFRASEQKPVWLAVLIAAQCAAQGPVSQQLIDWSFDGEQAYYTNASGDPVVIVPMEARLEPGQTLSVTWERGETAYSLRQAA